MNACTAGYTHLWMPKHRAYVTVAAKQQLNSPSRPPTSPSHGSHGRVHPRPARPARPVRLAYPPPPTPVLLPSSSSSSSLLSTSSTWRTSWRAGPRVDARILPRASAGARLDCEGPCRCPHPPFSDYFSDLGGGGGRGLVSFGYFYAQK